MSRIWKEFSKKNYVTITKQHSCVLWNIKKENTGQQSSLKYLYISNYYLLITFFSQLNYIYWSIIGQH